MFDISIYYIWTLPVNSSRCIDHGWIWTFFGLCGIGRDGTMCPWLHLSIAGLCLRAFWKHLASKSCADKKVHQTPCPPSQTLTPSHLCPSISLCTALWNPEEMIIFDSLFFLWSRTSSPTIHSSKHGVCTHTVFYFSRPVHSENQDPVALKTVQRKWTLWMFPNWLSWLI